MAIYNVKLITPTGPVEVQCNDDVYILDAAEEAGIELLYSCRAGSCSSCAGKVVEGSVDQPDVSFFDNDKMAGSQVHSEVTKSILLELSVVWVIKTISGYGRSLDLHFGAMASILMADIGAHTKSNSVMGI